MVVGFCCLIGFLLGIPILTNGGYHLFNLINDYSAYYGLLLLGNLSQSYQRIVPYFREPVVTTGRSRAARLRVKTTREAEHGKNYRADYFAKR